MKEFAEGVPATINGSVSNILQQTQILEFFPVREGKSLYYLAPFKFDNEDYLTFSLELMSWKEATFQVIDLNSKENVYGLNRLLGCQL